MRTVEKNLLSHIALAIGASGMTQEEVANRMRTAGYSQFRQSTVYKILSENRRLHIDEALGLCELLGLDFFGITVGSEWKQIQRYDDARVVELLEMAIGKIKEGV